MVKHVQICKSPYIAFAPDATDRRLSKRDWERLMSEWRNALREMQASIPEVPSADSSSTNSTDTHTQFLGPNYLEACVQSKLNAMILVGSEQCGKRC